MGRPRLEKPGDKFGEWTLLRPSSDKRKWVCQCSCGTIKEVRTDTLKTGMSRCCGCKTKEYQSRAKLEQGPKHNLKGMRFGEWTVLEYAGDSHWLCRCSCGTVQKVQTGQLRFGTATRCNKCNRGRYTSERTTTHGESHTKLYGVYMGMHERCERPTSQYYHRYGGRGIRVCGEWSGKDGYVHFAEWSKANGYKEGLTIDRIDNDGNYSPDNCRWVTQIENANNTSANRWIEINGEKKTVSQWARHFDLPVHLFYGRYVIRGWSLEETLMIPVGVRSRWNQKEITNEYCTTQSNAEVK